MATIVIGACIAMFPTANAAAAPSWLPQLWQVPEGVPAVGSGAGELSAPYGTAVDPVSGNIYLSDAGNNRIDEFTAWGVFVKAIGWNVDASAPAEEFQVCSEETGCKAGTSGSGAGQFNEPEGLAVDSRGNLYVVDRNNHRVQKFDSDGNFLLMFGGEVDKTTSANVCTAASTHVCGIGETGTANGQFASWPSEPPGAQFVAVGPRDEIYVGDRDRIQAFSADGAYQTQLSLPAEGEVSHGSPNGEGEPAGLAVDSAGSVYFSFYQYYGGGLGEGARPGIFKYTEGAWHLFADVEYPKALAVDANGDVYVARGPRGSYESRLSTRVMEFGADGEKLIPSVAEEEEEDSLGRELNPFAQKLEYDITGLSVSNSCNLPSEDLFVSYYPSSAGETGQLEAFGPQPDPSVCEPPARAPQITEQFASAVSEESAALAARINSRFWSTTSYYVEYGTRPCDLGGCTSTPSPPGEPLNSLSGTAVATKTIPLGGLSPHTTYHYRFVARTLFEPGPGGEAVVKGVGGSLGADGTEGEFTTTEATLPGAGCPGDAAYRTGASALLPDCRAYEMVSPIDKEGADIVALINLRGFRSGHFQSAADGAKLTYSAYRAFGSGVKGGPYTSQYIATRDPETGWTSEAISPARGTPLVEPSFGLESEYPAFTEDLCEGWLRLIFEQSEPALDPAAPAGYENLFQRNDCGVEAGSYKALTNVTPPDSNSEKYLALELQGVSADGRRAIFAAPGKLTGDAPEQPNLSCHLSSCLQRLYLAETGEPLRFICYLPDAVVATGNCTAGQNNLVNNGEGRTEQLAGAFSREGNRVVFGTGGSLYLRSNPAAPESARLYGAASGRGDLIGPATGQGNLTAGSKTIGSVDVKSGTFTVGQPISGAGIPPETTVTEINDQLERLKISSAATETLAAADFTGAASTTVTDLVTETGSFAAGQSITGAGIPSGTTVVSVAADSLTLSVPATALVSGASLEASSECTEAANACTSLIGKGAKFWGASSDLGRVVFQTGTGELREYITAEGISVQIASGGVIGVLGQSTDAQRVYFASTAVLAGENDEGHSPEPDEVNLYLHEVGGGTRFIGVLAEGDASGLNGDHAVPISPEPLKRAARVSDDGMTAAFVSVAPLTGFSNIDAISGEPDEEVFVYDARDGGGLVCVSCDPSGQRPSGRPQESQPWEGVWTAAWIPTWEGDLYASRALSANGERLFFNSFVPLVGRDQNGTEDVYEWERSSSRAECEALDAERYQPAFGGCLSLISTGSSSQDSEFLDADPSGANVFFATGQSLLPQDPGQIDIYDAREGGGLPTPPTPGPECEGRAACQGQNPPAPAVSSPASSTYEGPGNPPPKSCSKGKRKVVRNGKTQCVKPKKHHKKHGNKKHHKKHGKGKKSQAAGR
jgi:DNA-binding beta-propeller fold protein YncE